MTAAAWCPAQRVQVPEYNGAYGAAPQTFAPPAVGAATPMYGAPLAGPGFDPYSTPGVGLPPASTPYTAAPPVSPYAPYGGAPAYPPAPAAPYGATPYGATPYGTVPPYPAASPSDAGASPFAWEQGTYGFETADGGTLEFQKFLQELSFEHTYLYGDHSFDALELHRFEMSSTVALPLAGNIKSPLLITPGFAFNWFEGPVTVPTMTSSGADLPPRVYDAYLDLAWYPPPSPMFGAELGVRTGVWTDFQEVNSDSVRVLGRGLAKVRVSPTLELLVGAVYLDRLRVKLLPAGGFHLRPNDVWDLYMVFPNPKIRRRLAPYGTVDWVWFVAGEYGGGSWTVQRLTGPDRVDYNDVRVSTGFEWENQRQVSGHFEIGVVFDRELIYQSDDPYRFAPDTTIMLRGGVDF
ncbi:hypothetical protein Pla123a_41560 [Posidoniimonas polymericola]|uniref:Uncharacterized protein n=2 Tax=Posidoniimonas polymericola TaxID=2528002 RepID=A0A5C5XXC1_9BACT|nr:hypothetical protein Pla123a_41560 [Posidoniimonas polymericola]